MIAHLCLVKIFHEQSTESFLKLTRKVGNGLSVLNILITFEAPLLEECPKFDLLISLSFHPFIRGDSALSI